MSQATLQRRPLVKEILAGAADDLLVIAGLGSSNWDITNAGDRPLNMPLWGAMGAPVGMGLGLALANSWNTINEHYGIGRDAALLDILDAHDLDCGRRTIRDPFTRDAESTPRIDAEPVSIFDCRADFGM